MTLYFVRWPVDVEADVADGHVDLDAVAPAGRIGVLPHRVANPRGTG